MITAKQLAAMKTRAEEATPGPWTPADEPLGYRIFLQAAGGPGVAGGLTEEDACFIAAARTDVPRLIAEVERLTRERKEFKEIAHDAITDRRDIESEVERLTNALKVMTKERDRWQKSVMYGSNNR